MKRKPTAFHTRQYMKSEDFEVYYYQDTALHHVAPHYHDHYEILLFISGEIDYMVADHTYSLRSGDILFIPPHTMHYPLIKSEAPYERYVLWIADSHVRRLYSWDPQLPYVLHTAQDKQYFLLRSTPLDFREIQSSLLSLIRERAAQAVCVQLQCQALIAQILVILGRQITEGSMPCPPVDQESLITRILTYISSHLTEDLSLEQLGSEFFLSKYYISHCFKEQMGISIHQYILQKRLILARQAMTAGTPMKEICELCGFGDYSSFFRTFKKEYGISPKEFLQKTKNRASE